MRVKFWGTRGSIPTPGQSTLKYGGNTSCIQVISDSGQYLILDMGTGIRELGMTLKNSKKSQSIHILISHTHTDHIHGFPFFDPAFIKGNIINIYGPVHYEKSLSEIMSTQMDYSYFPVRTVELNAEVNYFDLKEQKLTIGDFKIKTKYMNHPVLSLGYRISADNKTVLYTGDTEPYYNFLSDPDDEEAELIVEEENNRTKRFVKDTDLLICDAQYTQKEYQQKRGWGHSPVDYDLQLALDAGVKKLALFHHDPLHSDNEIDKMVEDAQKWIRDKNINLKVLAAKEQQEIEV